MEDSTLPLGDRGQPATIATGLQLLDNLLASGDRTAPLTAEEVDSLRILSEQQVRPHLCTCLCKYFQGQPLQAKRLALFAGALEQLSPDGADCLITSMAPLELIFGFRAIIENFTQTVIDANNISSHAASLSVRQLTMSYESELEYGIWKYWIQNSDHSPDDVQRLMTILRLLSPRFLWKIKRSPVGDINLPQSAVAQLCPLLTGISTPTSQFEAELSDCISVLKGFFPDFHAEDIRFGDYYDLIDEIGHEKTKMFNYTYVKALVIKLWAIYWSPELLGVFRKAFESLSWNSASGLVKANKNLDLEEFFEEWEHALSTPSIEINVFKEYMFKKEHSDPNFCKTLVDQIHENIVEYATGLFHHAPYAAFCQSTGSCKTKTIISLGEHSILFYICGRANSFQHSDHPRKSQIFPVIQGFKSSADFLIFFYALLEEFLNLIRDDDMVSAVLRENETSLYCPPGTRSIDLVIPIVKGSRVLSSSAEGVPYVEPTINTISCIAVQVKNMKDKLYFKQPNVSTPLVSTVQSTTGDIPWSSSPFSVTTTSSSLSEAPFRETPSRPSSPSAAVPGGKNSYLIGQKMWLTHIRPNKWAPMGIIMAVGPGELTLHHPRHFDIQDANCRIFAIDAPNLECNLRFDDECRAYLDSIRDPPPQLPESVDRQFRSIQSARRKSLVRQIAGNWGYFTHPYPSTPSVSDDDRGKYLASEQVAVLTASSPRASSASSHLSTAKRARTMEELEPSSAISSDPEGGLGDI